ncbi:hypothetical protein EI165_14485 [Pseudoalteromonas nigrifaciens]|uniref:hypothetical protein n=1 Tax=Pseudoalteromonas nigrifaciens TaxID=28109 RepID=UPI001787B629|nr:hypothetical protein [Pseudoalteromonas nigrifaciens]MBE0421320.1 hypothetical protein [Pseudoalteromonas nigrifaciens]
MTNINLTKATEQLVNAKREFLPVVANTIVESIKAGDVKKLENAVGTIVVASPDIKVLDLLRAIIKQMPCGEHE